MRAKCPKVRPNVLTKIESLDISFQCLSINAASDNINIIFVISTGWNEKKGKSNQPFVPLC